MNMGSKWKKSTRQSRQSGHRDGGGGGGTVMGKGGQEEKRLGQLGT